MFNTKKGKKVIYLGIALIVLILIISIPFILHNIEHAHDHDHGPGSEYTSDTIIFTNRQIIDNLLGKSAALPLINCIETNLLSGEEKSSAPHKNESGLSENFFNLTFNEQSINLVSSEDSPYSPNFSYTYKFDASLSDGRQYKIITKVISEANKPDFAYSVIINISNDSLFICKDNDATQDNTTIINWLSNDLKLDASKIKNL